MLKRNLRFPSSTKKEKGFKKVSNAFRTEGVDGFHCTAKCKQCNEGPRIKLDANSEPSEGSAVCKFKGRTMTFKKLSLGKIHLFGIVRYASPFLILGKLALTWIKGCCTGERAHGSKFRLEFKFTGANSALNGVTLYTVPIAVGSKGAFSKKAKRMVAKKKNGQAEEAEEPTAPEEEEAPGVRFL